VQFISRKLQVKDGYFIRDFISLATKFYVNVIQEDEAQYKYMKYRCQEWMLHIRLIVYYILPGAEVAMFLETDQ
jgi:hypothetical protein